MREYFAEGGARDGRVEEELVDDGEYDDAALSRENGEGAFRAEEDELAADLDDAPRETGDVWNDDE